MQKSDELIRAVIAFHNFDSAFLDDVEYKMSFPDGFFNFNKALKEFPKKHSIEKITVDMNNHQDYIAGRDLDSDHVGFTVGRGKVMYHDFIWLTTGTCIVYPIDRKNWPRVLTGNKHLITIFFKPTTK